jgi:putative endopeptidase
MFAHVTDCRCLQQTGIELSPCTHYFRHDQHSAAIRRHYMRYIHRLFILSNHTIGWNDVEQIFLLERQLAMSHRMASQVRMTNDNELVYDLAELERMMPNLDWQRISTLLNMTNQTMIMSHLDYYLALDRLLVSQPLTVWKNKIRFAILHRMAEHLNRDFVRAHVRIYRRLITGQRIEKARWMMMIDFISKHIGHSLGQLYVEQYFSNRSKQIVLDLVENLIDVYSTRISRLSWLSSTTKLAAIDKIHSITRQIGYPSEWISYETIDIDRSSYYRSVKNILRFVYTRKMSNLRGNAKHDQSLMRPHMANAHYVRI